MKRHTLLTLLGLSAGALLTLPLQAQAERGQGRGPADGNGNRAQYAQRATIDCPQDGSGRAERPRRGERPGQALSPEERAALWIERLDLNGNGSLDAEELAAAFANRPEFNRRGNGRIRG